MILDVQDLSIRFAGQPHPSVHNLSFTLAPDQILGIVGESGSGKSISCLSLMGLLSAEISGTALFQVDSNPAYDLIQTSHKTLRQIRGRDIAMIFQDPLSSLNPFLRVGTQLIEPLQQHQKISKKAAAQQLITLLADTGIPEPEAAMQRYPHEFSGGQLQRLMIAMALSTQPRLLIADEPTTALDVTTQAQIIRLLQNLKAKYHLSVLFISHDLALVAEVADQVIVMRQGEVVERGPGTYLFKHPQHEYTQTLVDAFSTTRKSIGQPTRLPLLQLQSVSFGYNQRTILHNINLDIYRNEVLGLIGESGSGKSTLGRLLTRQYAPSHGQIIYDGHRLAGTTATGHSTQTANNASDAYFRQHIQMIFQNPYASLNPRLRVRDILGEPMQVRQDLLQQPRLTSQQVTDQCLALLIEVGLDATMLYRYPHEFSGGQRQRIAIARTLAMQPAFIVADEPVSALDASVQQQVVKLLKQLQQQQQQTLLFISHDMHIVQQIADRIAVMYQGQIVETGTAEQIFNQPEHAYTQKLISALPKALKN